jgi:hypothetical protein
MAQYPFFAILAPKLHQKRKSAERSKRQGTRRSPAMDGLARHANLVAAIHALVVDVSDDEWRKLPPNLASRVDELLYDHEK